MCQSQGPIAPSKRTLMGWVITHFSPKSRIPEASSTVTERRRPTEVTDGGLLVRCLRGGDGRSAHIARQVARLGNADLSKTRQPFV